MKRPLLHTCFIFLFIAAVGMLSVNNLWSNSSLQLTEEEMHAEKAPLFKKAAGPDEDVHSKWLADAFRFTIPLQEGHKLFFLSHSGELLVVHLDVETPPPDRA